jgi:UrcA family protein
MKLLVLALASAATLAASVPARAQSYGAVTGDFASRQDEEVVVTAPRGGRERSEIGAPIRLVSLSRPVRAYDLDLATPEGAHALRERVRRTARVLCDRLQHDYPVTESNSPPCYSAAAADGLYQADALIRDARAAEARR